MAGQPSPVLMPSIPVATGRAPQLLGVHARCGLWRLSEEDGSEEEPIDGVYQELKTSSARRAKERKVGFRHQAKLNSLPSAIKEVCFHVDETMSRFGTHGGRHCMKNNPANGAPSLDIGCTT